MGFRESYRRIFGVGLTGFIVTITVWGLFLWIDKILNIPKMTIHPVLRWGLILMFVFDVLYLFVGGLITLARNGWGIKLITSGPYRFVRHPLYSAFVYSASGLLALTIRSWSILLAALPLALFWSWHVRKEEAYLLEVFGASYREYMKRTNQFFPSWKTIQDMDET